MTADELRKSLIMDGILVSSLGLISEADLALALGIKLRTLQTMRLDGRAPKSVPVGNRFSYSLQAVLDWMQPNAATRSNSQ